MITIKPIGFRSPPRKDKFKPRAYIHKVSLSFDKIFLDVALVLCIDQPVRVELLGKILKAVIFSVNLPYFVRCPIIKILFSA
jgi:hypothetical protein